MAVSIISLIATGILVVCSLLSSSTWSVEDGNRTDERTPSSVTSNSIPDSELLSSPKRTSNVFRKPYPPYFMPYHFYPYMPIQYHYQRIPHRHYSSQNYTPKVKKTQTPMNNRRYDYEGRTFEPVEPWHHGGQQLDRTSDFYYVLPILLVIGLGSFLIPIISTFFTAMITSGGIGGCCAKRSTREESIQSKSKDSRDMNPLLSDKINTFWDSLEKSFSKFSPKNTLSSDSIDLKIETWQWPDLSMSRSTFMKTITYFLLLNLDTQWYTFAHWLFESV